MSDDSAFQLADIEGCFSGVIPAALATCSANGCPNVVFLSIVHRLGDDRVALSFQFFNKTARNIRENAHAALMMVEPGTFRQYRLSLTYEQTTTSGPVFERMETQLAAVAAQTGMTGTFKLRGADIYRVHEIDQVPCDLELEAPRERHEHLAGLDAAGQRLDSCVDVEALFEAGLRGIASDLGFDHSFLMIFDADREQLYTVASRGYDPSGVGAEITLPEGIIGTAAARKAPIRISHMERLRHMGQAIQSTATAQGAEATLREVPLPGLPDVMSQLAVPIVNRGELLGLFCAESTSAGAFSARDESALCTFARMFGAQLRLLQEASVGAGETPGRSYAKSPESRGPPLSVAHYASDDSVFFDGEYLIKGLPGRILRKLLVAYLRDGRSEFTNKELRLDGSLGLSPYRDNLEARLILLRKRLDERSPKLRMENAGRGAFRLRVDCMPQLVEHE